MHGRGEGAPSPSDPPRGDRPRVVSRAGFGTGRRPDTPSPGGDCDKKQSNPAPLPSNSREGPRQPISPQGSRGPLPPEHPVKEAAQRKRRTPHAATAEAATADRSTGTTHNAVLHPPSPTKRQRVCSPTSQPTKEPGAALARTPREGGSSAGT